MSTTVTTLAEGTVLTTQPVAARPSRWKGPRFIAEVFDGADEALAALEAVQGGLACTGFQTLDWLTVLYEDLAPAHRAMPRVVVVTERNSGQVVLVLPLIIRRKRTLRVARFAELGVAPYGAPILGPVRLTKKRSVRRTWRAVRNALHDVDMIRLERMPATIDGRDNPLLSRAGAGPSRYSGFIIDIPASVEAYLQTCSAAFRADTERSARLWAREKSTRFYHAATEAEIARVYTELSEQQAAQRASLRGRYVFEQPAYRAFYERVVMDGAEAGLSYLFALEAGGEVVATVFGIVHDGTFTLLRLSADTERWGDVAPGRLVLLEVMRHFVAKGITRFDLGTVEGTGEDDFKTGLKAAEVPLFDLIAARDLKALPRATFHRVKLRLRKNARFRALSRRLKRWQSR